MDAVRGTISTPNARKMFFMRSIVDSSWPCTSLPDMSRTPAYDATAGRGHAGNLRPRACFTMMYTAALVSTSQAQQVHGPAITAALTAVGDARLAASAAAHLHAVCGAQLHSQEEDGACGDGQQVVGVRYREVCEPQRASHRQGRHLQTTGLQWAGQLPLCGNCN